MTSRSKVLIVDCDSEDVELRKAYKYLRRFGEVNWKIQNQIQLPKTKRKLRKHKEFIIRRIGQCCCRYSGFDSIRWTSHHFGKYRWFFEIKEVKDDS